MNIWRIIRAERGSLTTVAFPSLLSYHHNETVLWIVFQRRRTMSHKTFFQTTLAILALTALLAIPLNVVAGGYCGSTYTAQASDTLGSVASTCGVTVYDLYTANPGVSYFLSAGQVLTIPNDDTFNNYTNYNGNPYNYNYGSTNAAGTYIVQVGDTLQGIATRFGIGLNALWYANPNLEQTNLYPGLVLNIPSSTYSTPMPPPFWYGYPLAQPYRGYYPPSYWYGYVPSPTPISVPLSAGTVPSNAPTATIELSNKANGDVYVSLQGTTHDGTSIIREYPVSGTFDKTIPAGYYDYVAWVGGKLFTGSFNLPGGSAHSLIFHSTEVDFQ
jgi:LysM repeat protein